MADNPFTPKPKPKAKQPRTIYISADHDARLTEMKLIAPDKGERLVEEHRKALEEAIDRQWRIFKAIGKSG